MVFYGKNNFSKLIKNDENIEKMMTNYNGYKHHVVSEKVRKTYVDISGFYGDFHSDEDMIKYVRKTLEENASRIEDWLENSIHASLRVTKTFDENIGTMYFSDDGKNILSIDAQRVTLILRKYFKEESPLYGLIKYNNGFGFFISTIYVEVPQR